MTETVYCGSCGGEIAAMAKFCKHCGTDQSSFRKVEEPAEVRQPPPAPSRSDAGPPIGVGERAEQVAPGATELAEQLATHLRTPGVALAGLSALIGAGICLVFGLVVAVVFPQASLLSIGGGGLFKETLIQAASFSQANLELGETGESVRVVPVLFVLIPILGVAAGAAALAPRTVGMPVRERLLWSAAAGVPFAIVMLVVALSVGKVPLDSFGGEVKVVAGSVFLLSLIWGALGGALGMAFALRQDPDPTPLPLPPAVARYGGIAWTALRPLALALATVAVLATLVWAFQVARDDDYRGFPSRSAPAAVGEQFAYAGDRAIGVLSLGAGASTRLGVLPAVPIDPARTIDLVGEFSEHSPSTYSVFAFGSAMPAYLFAPMLIVLLAIPALLALYAGFAVVRRLGEVRMERAAAWGAIVGPVWSIAMVILAALARKSTIIDPVGESVFIAFLLGGAVFGALGGVLAVQGMAQPPTVPQAGSRSSHPPEAPL